MSDTWSKSLHFPPSAQAAELGEHESARVEDELVILVSPTYEILMMHPGLETVWKRKPATFLGKKCYEELEKRQAPCRQCPGALALRTGRITEGERTAILDDGTRVPFHLRAYPIAATDGRPAGWVEVVKNLALYKEEEEYALFQIGLMKTLLDTSSMSTVLRLGLDAALRLQGAESGCAFIVDPVTGVADIAARRGLLDTEIAELAPAAGDMSAMGDMSPTVTDHGSCLRLTLPVVFRGRTLAALVLRLPKHAQVQTSTRARLEALACILASATARLHADRLRGDCGANMGAILDKVSDPILWIDDAGRVTSWNSACERYFGWSAMETLGRPVPFVQHDLADFLSAVRTSADSGTQGFAFRCQRREASPVDRHFRAAPLHDVIGDGSTYAVFALSAPASPPAHEAHPGPNRPTVTWPTGSSRGSNAPAWSTSAARTAIRLCEGHAASTVPPTSTPVSICWCPGAGSPRYPPSPRARTGRPRSQSYTVNRCGSE